MPLHCGPVYVVSYFWALVADLFLFLHVAVLECLCAQDSSGFSAALENGFMRTSHCFWSSLEIVLPTCTKVLFEPFCGMPGNCFRMIRQGSFNGGKILWNFRVRSAEMNVSLFVGAKCCSMRCSQWNWNGTYAVIIVHVTQSLCQWKIGLTPTKVCQAVWCHKVPQHHFLRDVSREKATLLAFVKIQSAPKTCLRHGFCTEFCFH